MHTLKICLVNFLDIEVYTLEPVTFSPHSALWNGFPASPGSMIATTTTTCCSREQAASWALMGPPCWQDEMKFNWRQALLLGYKQMHFCCWFIMKYKWVTGVQFSTYKIPTYCIEVTAIPLPPEKEVWIQRGILTQSSSTEDVVATKISKQQHLECTGKSISFFLSLRNMISLFYLIRQQL